MSFYDVSRKLLLLSELCFSVAAVICFGRGLPGQADEQIPRLDGCNADARTGLCFTSNPKALDYVVKMNQRVGESSFGLAILSFAVFFSRLLSWKLYNLPRCVDIVYDLLLSALWCISLALLFTSTELAGCRYEHVGSIQDIEICRLNSTRVAMAVFAVILYSGRVLVDAGSALGGKGAVLPDDDKEAEGFDVYKDEISKAQEASLSPVLAFFPHKI